MKIKKVAFLIALLMLFNVLLPVCSFAVNYYDYKQYVSNLIEQYGYFETPIANFDLYVNGIYAGSTNVDNNSSFVENLSELELSGITAKVGDKITIKNRSIVGSGSSIILYDLQVAQGIVGDTSSRYNKYSNINQVITAEVPGEMTIFLNVADNYSQIPNFENYSQYGNWRTELFKPSGDPNIQVKGWYFTGIKIKVEDPARPKAEFDIYYNGQNETDNYLNPVELEKYPETVNLIDKSTTEKGNIVAWEWGRKLQDGSWQFVSTSQNPMVTINENIETFRLRVQNSEGQWSTWTEHIFYSKLKNGQEPPAGDIRAVLDGPDIVEWGSTISLDSSRSTSTSTITKREYWRRTSSQSTWTIQSDWDNIIKPSERTIENGNASYIEFKLKITDNEGRTSEDVHRVNMVDAVEPEVHANLRFIAGDRKAKISLEDYLANKEMTIDYWVDASATSWAGTNLGVFYFFQNTDDSTIRKYEDDERNANKDVNFIQSEENPVRISTRDNPDSIRDAMAWGTFKFTPQNPQIKAAVMVRSSNVTGPYSFATAYHTVEFDVDSIPPTTELTIPNPFYPKEIDNLAQKTIVWTYHSEQNIPYKHSVVSLYKKNTEGYYEEVFRDRIMTEKYLVVQGNADEEYEIEVKVVDKLNKSSNMVDGQFTIIGAVPVIDIELDNKTIPDVLKVEVFNKTPQEIEELFPTSYTNWTIHDSKNNLILEGEGEAPKSVDLDEKFDRGKYTVTQHAVNKIGATAYASKEFEITSIVDFIPEPTIQFEDDMIRLIDKSKYITDKSWYIQGNNDTEFVLLNLNENNEFTRDEGTYQIRLQGKGYFQYFGETIREVIKTVTFLSTKPTAKYVLGGNLKMYKEITLDGSISEQMTESRLQAKYPIDFTHAKTMFVIEPITEPGGEVDISRIKYVLGHEREVENNQVIFKAKKNIAIRIDKEGWYRGSYKVYNGRKESDWYINEFYVSPELLPSVDINIGSTIVYRDPANQLKPKLEVIVDYSSPDDKISLTKSKLLVSYDRNNDGDFTNDGADSTQWIMKDSNSVLEYFSNINATWGDNKATFNLYIDNADKNFFGRFKFDFIAVEEPLIQNKNDVGEAPIMIANTFLLDDKKKIVLVDNDKPKIFLETTTNNSVTLWILEDSNRPFTDDELTSVIQRLEMERIKVEVYIIDAKTKAVRKYK